MFWQNFHQFNFVILFLNHFFIQITANECAEAIVALFDDVHIKSPIPDMSIQDLSVHMDGRVSVSALKLLISHMTFSIVSDSESSSSSEHQAKTSSRRSHASSASPLEASESLTLRAIIAAEKAIQSELSDIHDTVLPEMEARQKKLLAAIVRGRMALNNAEASGGSATAARANSSSLHQSLPPKVPGFDRQ
jgi:hypothetical protein